MADQENTYVAREEALQYFQDRQDAERWRKLIRIVGTVQSGSHTIVQLFWDIALDSPIIQIGDKIYHQLSKDFTEFDTLIDSIPYSHEKT